MEIIKELHEEIKAKQMKKEQSEFDLGNFFCGTLAADLKELLATLGIVQNTKLEMSSSNIR